MVITRLLLIFPVFSQVRRPYEGQPWQRQSAKHPSGPPCRKKKEIETRNGTIKSQITAFDPNRKVPAHPVVPLRLLFLRCQS
ncbi:hypothetical protein C8R44DRAFT_802276 [Mycena epipterygia]|nr:hypothetical protein C8R44DRAFT_802276 [Mycena epipterygia]